MAFVILAGRQTAVLSREQGLDVWEVLQGRKEPKNAKQAAYVAQIERIYLNPENAPADYLKMYPPGIDVALKERELPWYQK